MTDTTRPALHGFLSSVFSIALLLLPTMAASEGGGGSIVVKPQPIGVAKRLAGALVDRRGIGSAGDELPIEGMIPAAVSAPISASSPIARTKGPSSDGRRQPARDIYTGPAPESEAAVASRAVFVMEWKPAGSSYYVSGAFPAGFQGMSNGSKQAYLCRTTNTGQTIIGTVEPINNQGCLITNQYSLVYEYDVLVAPRNGPKWVQASNGAQLPANVYNGSDPGGSPIIICRVVKRGEPAPYGQPWAKETFSGHNFGSLAPGGCVIAGAVFPNSYEVLTAEGQPSVTGSIASIMGSPTPTPTPTAGPAPTSSGSTMSPSGTAASDAVSAQRRYEERKNREAMAYSILQQQAEDFQRLRKERMERAKEEKIAATKIRGPSPLGAINLLEGLHVDAGAELYQSDILQIDHQIYQDGNPKRGLFYFLPKRYDLGWSAENQYAMTVIYGLAEDKVEDGEVYMATRLYSGVDGRELSVARKLLVAYIRRHAREGIIPFKELRPFPLEATSDISLFGGANNDFAIPSDKISVQGVSGLLGVLDVSWATDVKRLLNVESLLRTDAGIHGSITFHAAGAEDFSQAVPLEISVSAPQTFGAIPFDRSAGWSNKTLYPVRLKRLHVLVLSPADRGTVRKHDPIVYSWDLGGEAVAPGASVDWDASLVPESIERSALRMWVTYAVDSDCTACDDAVFSEKFIPPMPQARPVVFTATDVFEATDAYRVSVHLRSPFLDPQRSTVNYQPPVTLEADGTEVPVGKLYLKDREFTGAGATEPFYQYRLEITMRDGTTHQQEDWTPSRNLDQLIGSALLGDLIPPEPELEPESESAPETAPDDETEKADPEAAPNTKNEIPEAVES